MTDQVVANIVAKAIQEANINDPGHPEWDQNFKSNEESAHLARAAIGGLKKAGYIVVKAKPT